MANRYEIVIYQKMEYLPAPKKIFIQIFPQKYLLNCFSNETKTWGGGRTLVSL
jgi:hypothetical protein